MTCSLRSEEARRDISISLSKKGSAHKRELADQNERV